VILVWGWGSDLILFHQLFFPTHQCNFGPMSSWLHHPAATLLHCLAQLSNFLSFSRPTKLLWTHERANTSVCMLVDAHKAALQAFHSHL
jgi:hypothetical protein